MTITVEQIGRRYYLVGNSFPYRDQLRDAGCHWDAGRKAWWTGKREDADDVAARCNKAEEKFKQSPAARAEREEKRRGDGDSTVVAGRAEYKGRKYYIVGRIERGRTQWDDRVHAVTSGDGNKCLLTFRDGSTTFWAAARECQVTKRYSKPQSIGDLAHFAERLKAGDVPVCRNCGSPSCDGARGGHCEED